MPASSTSARRSACHSSRRRGTARPRSPRSTPVAVSCVTSSDDHRRRRSCAALALASLAQVKIEECHALGDHLLSLAERDDDPVLRVEAHYVIAMALLLNGAAVPARVELEASLAHYDPSRSTAHISLYSQDPGVICRIRLSLDLWLLGEPEEAARRRAESLALAEDLGHPFTSRLRADLGRDPAGAPRQSGSRPHPGRRRDAPRPGAFDCRSGWALEPWSMAGRWPSRVTSRAASTRCEAVWPRSQRRARARSCRSSSPCWPSSTAAWATSSAG